MRTAARLSPREPEALVTQPRPILLQRKRGLGPIHPDGHELATFRSADALELVALIHAATQLADRRPHTVSRAPGATRASAAPRTVVRGTGLAFAVGHIASVNTAVADDAGRAASTTRAAKATVQVVVTPDEDQAARRLQTLVRDPRPIAP